MKKTIFLLSFIIGMMVNAQVVQNQVFSTTEEIHFVSDDGGGMYTVSGPGAGDDGFLAIYDEGANSWEVKNFPAKMNLGTVHNAEVDFAYTLSVGTTIAKGIVANNSSTSWHAIRKYQSGVSSHSQEEIIQANIKIFPPVDGNLYARVWVNNGGYAWSLGAGNYFVKINTQNLSLDWVYSIPQGYLIEVDDNLISTAKVYRYAVQSLPNGNIAVHVVHNVGGDWIDELWEFDPATGQKLGVIDDSNTDYDRNGTPELQYRFHRWKVVDGVLFHEFWQDPAAYPDDQNVGHWEKLEVPGWDSGTSNITSGGGWDSADLQVTAVSDWQSFDSFGSKFVDFSVENDGSIKYGGYKLSPKLEPTTGENIFYGWSGAPDIRDRWVRPNGDLMAMTLHGLYRFSGQQYTAQPGLNASGTGVVEAHENELYEDGAWISIAGEGALVLSSLPSVGDQPDSSWWTIPSEYHDGGHTAIMESHRPGEEGQLFFRVAILSNNNVYVGAGRRITLYTSSQVGGDVAEQEINGLKLYPNPVQDYLTVSADDAIDTVRVYNLLGVIVSESNSNSVYMGNLLHGVYIAEMISGDKMSRKKVIKK